LRHGVARRQDQRQWPDISSTDRFDHADACTVIFLQAEAVAAFIKFLKSPAAAATMQAKGMQVE